MNYLDTYYRAFTEFEKNIDGDRSAERLVRAIALADRTDERIEIVGTECRIDDDWIEEIERGLDHIGKAISQERQFILSNGEVVPIDKVKSVSRETISHLAKHSNFLKKVENSDDVMPEKLYTVERLSDYAVYENRFLYMLLCYLKEFITYRLNKIIDLTERYSGSLRIKKTVNTDGHKLSCDVKLDEEIANDPLVSENNPVKDKIAAINGLLSAVLVYLSTPLMEEVAKAAKLRPPVTETNVLKMDKDFRAAMQLYHFITAYDGDGFVIEQKKKVISPLGEQAGEQIAEAVALTSFLAYKHGMGAEAYLRERFKEEELRLRQAAEAEQLEKIEKLKRQIRQSGVGTEEYMLLLEQRNRTLENINMQARALENRVVALERELKDKDKLLSDNEEKFRAETENLTAGYESRISQLKEKEKADLARVTAEHRERCRAMQDKIDALKESVAHERAAGEERLTLQKRQLDERIEAAERQAEQFKSAAASAEEKNSRLDEENAVIGARLNAVLHEYGLLAPDADFTTKTSFNELERQYNAFTKLFRSEWKKTKKRIRREVLRGEKHTDGEGTDLQETSKEHMAPAEQDEKKSEISDGVNREGGQVQGAQEAHLERDDNEE